MKKYKVGVVGATGMVGQRFVSLLEHHPWFEVVKEELSGSSGRSVGHVHSYSGIDGRSGNVRCFRC